MSAVWELAPRLVPVLRGPFTRARAAWSAGWQRAIGGDLNAAALWLFLAHAIVVGVCVWSFGDLLRAIPLRVNDSDAIVLRALDHDRGRNPTLLVWYPFVLSFVTVVFGVAWYRLLMSRRSQPVDRLTAAAGLGLTTFTLLMWAIPHELFYRAQFPQNDLGGARCYETGVGAEEVLLFCPDAAPPRNHTVPRSSPQLSPQAPGYIFWWPDGSSPIDKARSPLLGKGAP